MDDISRINAFGYSVRKILTDNVKSGLESLTPKEIHYVNIAAWNDIDGNLICAVETNFRSKLKPETLAQIDAIKI